MKMLLHFLIKLLKLTILKVIERWNMPRPRVLKIGDKEIVLKNFSKEEADHLEAILSGVSSTVRGNPEKTFELSQSLKTIQPDDSDKTLDEVINDMPISKKVSELPYEAIGVFPHSGTKKWSYAVVKFNPETKEANVVSSEMHANRDLAVSEFKINSFKKHFV